MNSDNEEFIFINNIEVLNLEEFKKEIEREKDDQIDET